MHLTKNVSAICTALSVSCGLSKFRIREEFPGLRTAFRATSFVDILLVVSRAAKINQLIILTYCLKILIFYHTKILRYPKTIIIIVIITIYDTFKK